jgi:hypothetical protein
VLDSRTFQPIPGVCIVLGASCGPNSPRTDTGGRWSADVPVTSTTTYWDVYFVKDGYVTRYDRLSLPPGTTRSFTILLRRT